MFEHEFEGELNKEIRQLVKRYEEMIKNNESYFFEENSYEQLIDFYDEHEQTEKALQVIRTAITQYPYSAVFLVKNAQALIDSQQYAEAHEMLDKAEILDNMDADIYLLRAEIYVWESNHEQAISSLRQAFSKVDPEEWDQIYLEMAEVYEDWDKLDLMYESLKKAIRHNPENEDALQKIWFCVELNENFSESVTFHQKLIDQEPYAYLAWFNLAQAYNGLGLYEKAIDAYEFVIAINDRFEPAYKDCAGVYIKLEKYTEAIKKFKEALEISTDPEMIYYGIGTCFEKLKDHTQAAYYFRRATRLDPGFHRAYYKLGNTYLQQQKYEQALQAFQKALKLNSEPIEYLMVIAETYAMLEQKELAIEFYLKALKHRPFMEGNWVRLVAFLFESGELDEAVNTMNMAIGHIGEKASLIYIKSALLYALGKRKEALFLMEDALLLNYEDHHLLFDLLPELKDDDDLINLIRQYNP